MTDTAPEPEAERETDHDSPWKNALEDWFAEFAHLLFPQIASEIDWNTEPVFLDKELQQISADADSGRRHADKLVKVRARDGNETWVLIHVEIQGEPEREFARRMYTYQYRIRDRYAIDVVSLAVLTDTRAGFRPDTYRYQRWGCELVFRFPVCKLIDWEACWDELARSDNLFALVVMAQLKAKRLRDGARRSDAKVQLIRLMYERNYSREQIQRLFTVIDWILQLPRALEPEFLRRVYEIEESKSMPYINTAERIGIEKGIAQGIEKGIEKGLAQGLNKGREESRCEIALNLIALGSLDDEQIAAATQLGLAEVRALRQQAGGQH